MTLDRKKFVLTAAGYGVGASAGPPKAPQEWGGANVRAFGAVGDGVTDDTTAIQRAIDAAETQREEFRYLAEGNTRAITATVFFPPGVYRTTGLTTRFASLVGAGPSATFLKHDASGPVRDLVTIGDGGSMHVSSVHVRDLALVGDGDLTASSGRGSQVRSRSTLYANNAIRKCFVHNVTASQAEVGILVRASWTFNLKNAYVFCCPRCVEWTGGHGSVENCRFDATYNPAAGSNDHAFFLGYDHSDGTQTATMVFLACCFQGAGKSGFYADDVMTCSFVGCLFERNNRSDDGLAYTHFASNHTRAPVRIYTFLDCLWTPAGDLQPSSVALAIDAAHSVQLIGCNFKDSSARFATSLRAGRHCRSVISQGTEDQTSNGKSIDARTTWLEMSARGLAVGDSEYGPASARVRGPVEVNRDGDFADSRVDLTGDSGHRRGVRGLTNGFPRWEWGITEDPEVGSGSGSHWSLRAHTDDGRPLDTPIHVDRGEDGPIRVSRPLRLALHTDESRGAPGEAGRVIFNVDDGALNVDNGRRWVLVDGTPT